jgi:hypothetical protein
MNPLFGTLYLNISGSAITPTYLATISPMDLDIANPGTSSLANQTLYAPYLFPSYKLYSTLPPASSILLASKVLLGL